ETPIAAESAAPIMGDTIEVQSPPKTFSFDKKQTSTEQSKSFAFGTTPAKDASFDTSKPFSFGVKTDYTWTPDKPIKFNTPPSIKPSSTYTFGQSSVSQPQPPFTFGGLSTPVPSAPKLGSFGGSPST